MVKKGFGLFSVLLFSSLFFAANLTVWTSWEGEDFFTEIARLYTQETGIEVKILHIPKLDDKLFTALRTGNLPDISMVKDVYTERTSISNSLTKLDNTDIEIVGNFSKESLKPYSFKGSLLAIPYYADVQTVFVNLSLLRSKGVSLDFGYSIEDIEKISREFASSEVTPAAWDFMSPYVFYPFLTSFDTLWNEEGKPVFDSPKIREGITYVKELFDKGVFVRMNRGALVNSFEAGKIAILIQGSYLARDFEEAGIEFQMLPFPKVKGKKVKPIIDSKGFAIFNAAKKDIALDFLRFLYSRSMNYCVEYNKIPLWTQTIPEELSELYYILKEGQYMYNGLKFQSLYFSTMKTVLQAVYSGSLSIDEALKSAQDYVNSNW